jgi:hypothetical protein
VCKTAHGPLPNWLNAAVNKVDYIAQVQVAVSQLHKCGAVWRATVPVHEVFQCKTVWQGDVEVFDLTGHPKAKRAYAWSHLDGKQDERTRFVAVLEIPPVESAETAVRVQILKDVRSSKKDHLTQVLLSGSAEEVRRLACSVTGGRLKIDYYEKDGWRALSAKGIDSEFRTILDGLQTRPAWLDVIKCPFETEPLRCFTSAKSNHRI